MDEQNFITSKAFKIVLVITVIFVMLAVSITVLAINSDQIKRSPEQVLMAYIDALHAQDINKVAAAFYPVGSAQYFKFIEDNADTYFSAQQNQVKEIVGFEMFNHINQQHSAYANVKIIGNNGNVSDGQFKVRIFFTKYDGLWYLTKDLTYYINLASPSENHDPPPNTVPLVLTSLQKKEYSTYSGKYKIHHVNQGEHINSQTFRDCTYLNEIVLPENINYIEPSWFYDCKGLVAISFANGHKTLTALDGVVYTKDMKTLVYFPLGKGAAQGSPKDEFHIPNSVQVIGRMAFAHYNGQIKKVVFPKSLTTIEERAFYRGFSSHEYKVVLNDGLKKIDNNAFEDVSISEIALPKSVTSIGQEAFKNASNLHTLSIPQDSELKSIGYAAFEGATSLTGISIPSGVSAIPNWLFDGCHSLSEINLPANLKSIGMFAFRDCYSLSDLFIPASVDYIGKGAFQTINAVLHIQASSQPANWNSGWSLGHRSTINWGASPVN